MPSNYTGVANNFTPGPVTVAEPVDGDPDNGVEFQTPLSTTADVLAAVVDRLESMLLGPSIPRISSGLTNMTTSPVFLAISGAYGRIILCGATGATTPVCVTSDDGGITWTTRASFATAFGTNLPAMVVSNGTTVVAVGAGGKIASTTDGITWTAQTSGVATALNSVTWSPTNSLWLAAGASTVVLTSPDAATWTPRATGQTAGSLYGVWGAGPGLFVVVTQTTGTTANSIATSANGTSWTLRTAPAGTMGQVSYAAATTPYYALWAAPSTTSIWTSPDGINWTSRATVPSGFVTQINPWFFTQRSMVLYGLAGVMSSKDLGVTWTLRPPPYLGPNAGSSNIVGASFFNGGVWWSTVLTSGTTFAASPNMMLP